jgi:SAM-dependent methyltransferase
MLGPRRGETLLDVGCGTGYFTRRFARDAGVTASGLDPNGEWLAYARGRAAGNMNFVEGKAEALPFPDRGFDLAVSVTALCFAADEKKAVAEMLRVTRRRFAIGLLNRNSLLFGEKAGRGAYAGAHWHTADEARALFAGAKGIELRSAVFLPRGGLFARAAERFIPSAALGGALLAVAGSIA